MATGDGAQKPKKGGLFALLRKAAGSALRGGIPGAIAMLLQVVLLMWLRTTINYQYRNGGTVTEAFATLYAQVGMLCFRFRISEHAVSTTQGGILRFYQGAQYALIQGPMSRFGDTAANEGVKELLAGSGLSLGIVTFCASCGAAIWRIFLTPVDTLKTTLQGTCVQFGTIACP